MFDWNNLLNIIIGFSSGGIITAIVAWKTRKAEIRKVEATALDLMQDSYKKFVEDQRSQLDELRIELKEVKNQLREYRKKCTGCVNNAE